MNLIDPHCDLSIVIPIVNSSSNLAELLPQIHAALMPLSLTYEIIVAIQTADEETRRMIQDHRASMLSPSADGYGAALQAGIKHAVGSFIIVMDADQIHPAVFLHALWQARETADVVIASRYIFGGHARMPLLRLVLSKALNVIFSRGLDLRVRDMSSGFRLYKADVVKRLAAESRDYDILQEILVKALMEGFQIREIPFEYVSRENESAFARVIRFGLAYLKTFARLWRIRNSIASADYDARAYDALMPPQRYWQRQRYHHITGLIAGQGKCLDVGCGSSRIIGALPSGSLAVDILIRKLRYASRFGQSRIQASIFNLPVADEAFPCVLCSQVIEHIPRANVLNELDRVLQPGGFLILGTPDYGKWQWLVIEWLYKILLPQAYADEHITHYTYNELFNELVTKRGYQLRATRYILQGELILGLVKPSS
jgi:dolichol-phosphate mannosyltransferase